MSIAALREALGIIASNPEHASFVGQLNVRLVEAAEQALAFNFPASYREFVETLGAGSFGSFEVYGVVDGNLEQSAIPSGVRLALDMRRRGELAANLLPISDLGYGGYYCIERRDAGHPVVVVEFGMEPGYAQYEVDAPDFGEFFLKGVTQQLQRFSN